MQPGEIYKTTFDERPLRIIGFDEYEVFYDCLWAENRWTFSGKFTGKSIFYRMSREMFESKAVLIEWQKLTGQEYQYFRPDLPMRFGRTQKVSWNAFDAAKGSGFLRECEKRSLETNRIVLVPLGPKGAFLKGEVMEGPSRLTEAEIIYRAKEIQESVNPRVSEGIGFYRLGWEKGLPSYAIGEYFDPAGILKE